MVSHAKVTHKRESQSWWWWTQSSASDPALLGKPGVLRYNATWKCQFWMSVQYTTHDGFKVGPFLSCDDATCGWYKGEMRLPPGAKNIAVYFDVRGGHCVWAVDRANGKRWKQREGKFYQEVFLFPDGGDLEVDFSLAGTPLHAYVDSAWRTCPRTRRREAL